MRPLKLTMQAFGPYTSSNTIDFRLFSDSELFLITGTTGSGKTSIFDAISYALYGKPSGNIREVDMLRNISADNMTETFVDFEFRYHGHIYKIWRKPRYMRLKKSGEGYTESIADAKLSLPSGEVISGVKTVNEKILDILKINQQQFSQIVMIAQNDFLKFLTSDTSSKKSILRTIFNTDFYAKFEKELKNLANIEKEKLVKVEYEYQTRVKSIAHLDRQFDEKAVYHHESIIQTLQTLQKDYKLEIKELTKQKKSMNAKLQDIHQQRTLALTHNKILTDLENYETELNILSQEKSKIDEKRQMLQALQLFLKEFMSLDDEYEKVSRTFNEESLRYRTLQDRLMIKKQEREALQVQSQSLKDKEQELVSLKTKITEIQNETLKHDELKEFKQSSDTLNKQYQEFMKKLLLKIKKLDEDLVDLDRAYEDELQIYVEKKEHNTQLIYKRGLLEKEFLESQAGLLAKHLRPKQCCPVCGSTDHPAPAELSSHNVDLKYYKIKETVDQDTVALNKQIKVLEDLKERIQKKKQESLRIKEDVLEENLLIEEQLKRLSHIDVQSTDDSIDHLSETIKRLRRELLTLEITIEKSESHLKYKLEDNLELLLRSQEKKVLSLEDSIHQIKELSIKLNEDYLKLSAEVDSSYNLNAKLKREKDELYTRLNNKIKLHFKNVQEYEEIKKQVSHSAELEETIKTFDHKLTRVEGLYQDYKKQSEGLTLTDTKRLDQIISDLDVKLKICDDTLMRVLSRKDQEFQLMNSLIDLFNKREKLDTSYQNYQSLADTASGALSQKDKIQFETYAQMAYFERILHFANQRLKVMSNHQYELVRRDKITNRQSQAGLDIDIFDHYHGTKRDVGSLSGGELFNASLALALGLSDVMQHVSGGIKIDALFIDEGFGSLSDEYLDNAIQTLLEVAGSDRMIGVISHVKELKDAISKQIMIEKDQYGSHIHLKTE